MMITLRMPNKLNNIEQHLQGSVFYIPLITTLGSKALYLAGASYKKVQQVNLLLQKQVFVFSDNFRPSVLALNNIERLVLVIHNFVFVQFICSVDNIA